VKKSLAALLLGATLAFATSASATMTTDRDEFEDAASNYSVTSTYGTAYSTPSTVSLGGVNATASSPLDVRQIGSSWFTGTWIQKYSGQVLFSQAAQSITLTFDKMVTGFSFLAEANIYGTSDVTLSAGGETLTQSVVTKGENGGAAYFAWFGDAISSLTISTSDSLGFAFGKIAIATNGQAVPTAVPGPEAGAGLGALAFGGMALWMKRRRKDDLLAA